MTLGAAVHMCSLASYQEGLLQLVHTWQINTRARHGLGLHAALRGHAGCA